MKNKCLGKIMFNASKWSNLRDPNIFTELLPLYLSLIYPRKIYLAGDMTSHHELFRFRWNDH